MKSITLFLFFVFASCNISLAQTLEWKLNGNTVTSDSKLGTNNGYDLIIETGNLERFRVTDAGNIGIGLALPVHKLDIVGSVRIDGELYFPTFAFDPQVEEIRMLSIEGNGEMTYKTGSQLIDVVHKFDCRPVDGGTAPLWRSHLSNSIGYLSTGYVCPAKVGIGIEFPETELHVVGRTITSRLYVGDVNSIIPSCRVNINGTPGNTVQSIFRVYNDGGVQIRSFTEEEHPFTIFSGTRDLDYFKIRENGAWDINYFGVDTESALIIRTPDENNDLKEMIALGGDGRVFCQALTVKRTPFWGDFVFSAEYDLLPLNEVESFIEENGHLPEMPSAQQVEAEGADLYELIRLMNIKIEELTLYAIEQEKKIAELESKLK